MYSSAQLEYKRAVAQREASSLTDVARIMGPLDRVKFSEMGRAFESCIGAASDADLVRLIVDAQDQFVKRIFAEGVTQPQIEGYFGFLEGVESMLSRMHGGYLRDDDIPF